MKVKAELKQGDILSCSNLVCSLGFDRDKEFFAAAGVNRKIKIFECDMILNQDCDIHYPVVEMMSRSKLSCICWNNYIKNQIASSDFEGIVQVGCPSCLKIYWSFVEFYIMLTQSLDRFGMLQEAKFRWK